VQVERSDGAISQAGIGLTSVSSRNLRAVAAEQALSGQEPSAQVIADAARLAAEAAEPKDDIRGSAAYKKDMVRVLLQRGLRTAIDRARAGGGPSLIEAVTYRHGGHSRADPGKYRPDDEVAAWKARDPIPAYRQSLEATGVAPADLDAIETETHDAVAAAEAEARAAPEPTPEVLETQLWSDGGSAWRN